MMRLAILGLVGLLLLAVSCSRSGTAPPHETASGTLGSVRTGGADWMFEGRAPYYRDGDLLVYVPQAAYPGRPLAPACVLVMRLVRGGPFYLGGGLTSDGRSLEISPVQQDGRGNEYRFAYKVAGDPLAERFEAGGRAFKPEDGRVFLVDLTADPPELTQVNADLAGLFPHPDRDLGTDVLKAAVAKLSEREEAVRRFLGRIGQ
jgi:hypothetical protein